MVEAKHCPTCTCCIKLEGYEPCPRCQHPTSVRWLYQKMATGGSKLCEVCDNGIKQKERYHEHETRHLQPVAAVNGAPVERAKPRRQVSLVDLGAGPGGDEL